MTKILIKKDCKIGDKSKKHLRNFVNVATDFLDIKLEFTVKLIGERESENHTTAYYSPNTKLVVVKTNNRSLVDIMRSIAHEMVHHKQFQNDELVGDIPDIGGKIEDEANALAGQIIKIYSKQFNNKDVYDLLITENHIVNVDENYETAIEDKRKIDSIIKKIDNSIAKWIGDDKKDSEFIKYNKNEYPNSSSNLLAIRIPEENLIVKLIDSKSYKNLGDFNKEKTPNILTVKTKFKTKSIEFTDDVNDTIYHELQHKIDFETKYKTHDPTDNYHNPPNNGEDDFHNKFAKYMSQPMEFNAWFTSIIMPSLQKYEGIGFKEMMRKLYDNSLDCQKYFGRTDKDMHQRFLKRAYKYYIEHNNRNKKQ